jgi:hypothetical protein
LSVSSYDRVASLLIALLILVGVSVTMLFIVWYSNQVWVGQEDVAIEFIEPLPAGGPLGEGNDLEEPGDEEVEDLQEPEVEEMLDAVTDAISSQTATLEALEGDARASNKGKGGGGGGGPGGAGTADIIPRWERWQILFTTSTLDVYAKQLDSFGIELGVLGGGSPTIDYAFNLAKRRPETRKGKGEDEERIYMMWKQGALKAADKQLLSRAGISTSGKTHVQFYPPPTEQLLFKAEHDHNPELSILDIEKTVFGVKLQGGKYIFHVLEQRKRAGRR